jgi:hypothetical protein
MKAILILSDLNFKLIKALDIHNVEKHGLKSVVGEVWNGQEQK